MLINCDANALEWLGAIYHSKDRVGYEEIKAGFDQHSDNQQRLGLPSRLLSKTFLFRLIYGGSAYAYSADYEFSKVNGNTERHWQERIDKFYDKYKGLKIW